VAALEPEAADLAITVEGYRLPPASQLSLLEPLGESNREPLVLLPEARVEASKVVGEGHLKLELAVGADRLSAFGLGMGDLRPDPGSTIAAAGALRPDGWQGGEAVELRLSGFGKT
jgi:single-stranded-DNA-specific exonuclease